MTEAANGEMGIPFVHLVEAKCVPVLGISWTCWNRQGAGARWRLERSETRCSWEQVLGTFVVGEGSVEACGQFQARWKDKGCSDIL